MNKALDATKVEAASKRAAYKAVHGTREERSGRFMTPKAFISYSHDSPAHKAWVLKLGADLRAAGVDVILDQWDLVPGQDVSLFMQKGISEADRVIMVCSSDYVERSEKGSGGVGYERLIVTSEVVQTIDTKKFIPILRGGKKTPSFLGPRLYINFENDHDYEARLVELAREIHGAPLVSKPPLGPNPFSGTPIVSAVAQEPGQAESLATGEQSITGEWFDKEFARANAGLKKIGLSGFMELRVGALHQMSKSQIELLNAVRQSEIRTFGWPIGVLLENREEYRPRAYGDGIKAEIAIGSPTDRTSYDYWAVRSSGDFYLLQSLFEDSRKPSNIFFDTRIVRVTESLMFTENLYKKLGVPPETRIRVRVAHHGLQDRILASASQNRFMSFDRTAKENESSCEIITVLGTMGETRVEDVRKLLEPMFMLFDFMEFGSQIYEDIVRKFEKGEVR
jgi:hypothetical protein